jgi:HK97 family phage major capsid protein
MTDITARAQALNAQRLKIKEEMIALSERAKDRLFDAEENVSFDRMSEEVRSIDAQVKKFVTEETRDRDAADTNEQLSRMYGETAVAKAQQSERAAFVSYLQGGPGNYRDNQTKHGFSIDIARGARELQMKREGASEEEIRTVLWDTGSSGTLVPTTLNRNLYEYLEASVAMMQAPTTKIVTSSGENLDFPRVLAHAIGTQVIAQGTTIGGTDPTFSKMTLNSFKYGQLVQLSSEVVQDSGIDIVGFVGRDVARGIGRVLDADFVVGTGTGEPLGITAAALVGGYAGTIASGGSLITPTYEKLVDLVYSITNLYRTGGSAAWLMNDLTAAQLRKLRDGGAGTIGAVMWEPSLTNGIQGGQPDRLLGYPVYTDPNVASLASNAKVLVFGDFSAYYIRMVGQMVFERSDDFAFGSDLITYRGKIRADGDVIDLTALNIMKQSV